MAYEDRILRMARRPKSANFNDAKDRYRARTRGGYPRRFRSRGLGSFANQMMTDQLRGPVGMNNQPNQPQNLGKIAGLLKTFKNNLLPLILTPPGVAGIAKRGAKTAADFLSEEEEIETPDYGNMIPIPLAQPDDSEGAFLGDTGYFDSPYYELGSGIIYDAPDGGTIYNPEGFDAGDILRPVEKRIFPMNIERGPFGDARDVNPEISVDYGSESGFTMPGDPVYGKQLDAFNDYNIYNTRQGPLDDYSTPTLPIAPPSNFNFLKGLFGYNRGGIASLKI